ncbi:hypothetical protein GIB67_036200 [Kingdonia uniflora]|uniref:Auxilin-related protein 2 n=1 Tax=Kingdonia uniflora TaxID=39325 RepID=A0A7J7L4U3_9MAGN|nr:hypothetical protein GIB67_036200 [Kingdonia uniflora]
MDEFPGLLARDFGFRAQGKHAPMSASKSQHNTTTGGGALNFTGMGSSDARSSSFTNNRSKSKPGGGNSLLDDHDGYKDVFGGPPKYTTDASSYDYNSIFEGSKGPSGGVKSVASLPVYDKPVYDDDIFDGVPGLKSSMNDVFSSISSPPKQSDHYDELFGNLGKTDRKPMTTSSAKSPGEVNKGVSDFDDLLPGFGGTTQSKIREDPEINQKPQSTAHSSKSTKTTSSGMEDPFVVLESSSPPAHQSSGFFTDSLDQINNPNHSGGTRTDGSSVSGAAFDDPLDGLTPNFPFFSSDMNNNIKNKSPSRGKPNPTKVRASSGQETTIKSFFPTSDNASQNKVPVENYWESHETLPEMPTASADFPKHSNQNGSTSSMKIPKSEEIFGAADDVWLTVSEIPLFTQPTSAPPPSRPPPRRPVKVSNANRRGSGDEYGDVISSEEEVDINSSAAASAAELKDAIDRAGAKIKQAREERKWDSAKATKIRESTQQDKEAMQDAQERELREQQEREREAKEREQRRLEKEERAREIERERERTKKLMERATREARERAAAEARLKADKAAADKAKQANERAAVQRAQNEARERAAAEAKDKMERAAADAKEKEAKEAREKEARERAAVARAEADARHRAERAAADRVAAEVRVRAAAVARENLQRDGTDLDSFFGTDSRPISAHGVRTATSDSAFDAQSKNSGASEVPKRKPSGNSSNIKKASSTTTLEDFAKIFEGAPSPGVFQDAEGGSDVRRKAATERDQRTHVRQQQALANLNQRDLESQRAQEERHRIAETLDFEIKRWSAGKEGNLRALLSTLQYALWPECGWQPVSLTDLITGAQVKKIFKKATLCIHPDKVQQKGATLQQKYIAEKVFYLLQVLYLT